jgi:hypothetical protein
VSGPRVPTRSRVRARIDALADALVPGGDGMPAASVAGATGEPLDRVLAIRDDLRPALARVLAAGGPPLDTLRALHADDREAFEAFAALISCAYAMCADARESLGYPGQRAYPIPDREDPDVAELLAPVRARGPRYVATPAGDAR